MNINTYVGKTLRTGISAGFNGIMSYMLRIMYVKYNFLRMNITLHPHFEIINLFDNVLLFRRNLYFNIEITNYLPDRSAKNIKRNLNLKM